MVYFKQQVGTITGYGEPYFLDLCADKSDGQKNIIGNAQHEAEDQVKVQYPHAVYRERQDITRQAEKTYQQWQALIVVSHSNWPNEERYQKQLPEQKRLYVSAFIGKYQEELAKKDEAARPKVQPQPQPTPQPQPAATPTGAYITITREEHTANIHSYWLKVADPRNLDEAYDAPEPLTVDYSEVPATDTTARAASAYGAMPSGTYASSSSDAYKPTQRRKPRVYWGKR